jgi:hypothetical protein
MGVKPELHGNLITNPGFEDNNGQAALGWEIFYEG